MQSIRAVSYIGLIAAGFFAACASPLPYPPMIEEPPTIGDAPTGSPLPFSMTADMREFTGPEQFAGALVALAATAGGAGGFMISPGDIDPPATIRATIDGQLGVDFPWFPVVGNHEAETPGDMDYLRGYPLPRPAGSSGFKAGPGVAANSMYSFDAGAAHFIILNEYFDGSRDDYIPPMNPEAAGDAGEALLAWLAADIDAALAAKPRFIFVFGHEPIYPLPDATSGRIRHLGDSLDAHPDNARRLLDLLKSRNVSAYICGHTHNFSAALLDGLLQLDLGHARGSADTGAMSSFVKAAVYSNIVEFAVYRSADGIDYRLDRTIRIRARYSSAES